MTHRSLASVPAALALSMLGWTSAATAQPAPVVAPPKGMDQAAPEPAAEPTDTRPRVPLAGYYNGRFFMRNRTNSVRWVPIGLAQVDLASSFGPGLADLTGPAAAPLGPRGNVTRAQIGFTGHLFDRWHLMVNGIVDKRPLRAAQAFVDAEVTPWLHTTIGQVNVPLTMSVRTPVPAFNWLNRPVAARFVAANLQDQGLMVWGETKKKFFRYEVGAFGGDGAVRGQQDRNVDAMGRLMLQPLANSDSGAKDFHIGFGFLVGKRQKTRVNYGVPGVTSNQGYQFFSGTYVDSNNRTIAIIPSSNQRVLGFETRLPWGRLDLRAEGYHVLRQTREAVSGLEANNTERYGELKATAGYVSIGYFVWGDPKLRPGAGRFVAPDVNLKKKIAPPSTRHGLEVLARVEAIRGTYEGASRSGIVGDLGASQDMKLNVMAVGLRYFATRHVRILASYNYYSAPGAGIGPTSSNLLQGPGNRANDADGNQMHEIAMRAQMAF